MRLERGRLKDGVTQLSDEKPLILAVDPGLANGACLVRREGLEKLHSTELPWIELTDWIASVFIEHGNDVDVVVESFRITPFTAKTSAGSANTAIEVIGQVKLLMKQFGVGDPMDLPQQTPGDAQAFADGKKLRALGWWHKGGEGHANMALRHAALRLLRTGCRERVLLGLDTEN